MLGCAIYVVGLVQVAGGYIRPDVHSGIRKIWKYCHLLVGAGFVVLSFTNMFVGYSELHRKTGKGFLSSVKKPLVFYQVYILCNRAVDWFRRRFRFVSGVHS